MKRMKQLLTIFIWVGLLCFPNLTVCAKELEGCRQCSGAGGYHCVWCDNAGEVVCDGCGGTGGSKCQGDTYKGNSCDNGYYVCKSCNGDGKNRTGEGNIIDGVCGNCNGAGQFRCIACSNGTPGWHACTRCEGDGITSCQGCIPAREIGYKCPKCTGTGYIRVGIYEINHPEINDGVQNVPEKGDHIIIDEEWHYYIYGQNSEEIFPIETVPSTIKPEQTTDGDSMPSNKVEEAEVELESQNDVVPDNRHTNYEIPTVTSDGTKGNTSATIEVGRMSNEEQAYYTSLEEDDLNRKLANVQHILASAQPGRFEEGIEDLINSIAEKNGYNTLEEGRILPLYFEGHEDLGFPIAVRIYLEKGVLDGGTDLYIYHICDDKTIEFLGKAEYQTYDDGSVESILFYTTGFSSFFTAASELNTIIPAITDDGEALYDMENNIEKVMTNEIENGLGAATKTQTHRWVLIGAIVVLLIVVIAVVTRNKYKGTGDGKFARVT